MNLKELRAAYKTAYDAMQDARTACEENTDETRTDALHGELQAAIDTATQARDAMERGEEIQRARDEFPAPAPAEDRERGGEGARVTHDNELVYRQGGRHSFFSDAFRSQRMGDYVAMERLKRHAQQMDVVLREKFPDTQFRDVGTGAFAGLTIPQFLIDEYAPLARAGRPYANMVRRLPLPESGMVISISRITTGTAVAVQATENAAVQETDIDDTKLDINVRTYAGQQDVSRQALERSEMVDMIVFQDLVGDYHAKLDAGILNDDGTSGTHLGLRNTGSIISVAYTDASPTVPELFPKGADAAQQINTQRFLPPLAWLMHPRRWGWMTAALDSSNRPLVVPNSNGPFNALAVGDAGAYGQVVGTWHGLPVVTDANILTNLGAGTNEDEIYGMRTVDDILWEEGDGMPRQLRFEETQGGNLSVKLVVYGYSAFTAGRYPKANAKIAGTGLVTPTF